MQKSESVNKIEASRAKLEAMLDRLSGDQLICRRQRPGTNHGSRFAGEPRCAFSPG